MWTKTDQQAMDHLLKTLSDEKYKEFHTGLGVGRVLGVRIPDLDRTAKQLIRNQKSIDYLEGYASCHYEGDVIYGMLIGYAPLDDDLRRTYIFKFCEMIDNWATCDYAIARWKFIQKQRERYLLLVDALLASKKEWHCRVAYVILLNNYLNDEYVWAVIQRLDKIILPAYYTQMAAAWLISMGLVKYPDLFEPWLQKAGLDPFVYQKALQKAIESHQIASDKKKLYKKWKKQLTVE